MRSTVVKYLALPMSWSIATWAISTMARPTRPAVRRHIAKNRNDDDDDGMLELAAMIRRHRCDMP